MQIETRQLNPLTVEVSKRLAPVIRDYVVQAIEPLLERIAELETKSLTYAGIWDQTKAYGVNTLVTDKGAMWLCRKNTVRRPGSNFEDWKLVVKSPK